MFQTWAKVLINMANPNEGEGVLGLTCATGTVARMIAPRVGATGSVAGLDFSPRMLEVARGAPSLGGPAVQWVEGDAAAAL
jgi:ubiquinone/menaquinone biosynthesis C-methylase UbiE